MSRQAYMAYLKRHGTFGSMSYEQFSEAYPTPEAVKAAAKSGYTPFALSPAATQFSKDTADLAKWPGAPSILNTGSPSPAAKAYLANLETLVAEPMGVPASTWAGATYQGTAVTRPKPPPLMFPGLPKDRRVVLDLSHTGYGISAEAVNKDGELLAIVPPDLTCRPVPGAIVVREHLGTAVERLLKEGARFDLIVCEVPHGDLSTPMVGFFPAPAPLAKSGRRLLIPGAPATPKIAPRLWMGLAVWRAAQALLSTSGEALIRLPRTAAGTMPEDEPGIGTVWWTDRQSKHFDIYVRRDFTGQRVRTGKPPEAHDRPFAKLWSSSPYTKGQRELFLKCLKP